MEEERANAASRRICSTVSGSGSVVNAHAILGWRRRWRFYPFRSLRALTRDLSVCVCVWVFLFVSFYVCLFECGNSCFCSALLGATRQMLPTTTATAAVPKKQQLIEMSRNCQTQHAARSKCSNAAPHTLIHSWRCCCCCCPRSWRPWQCAHAAAFAFCAAFLLFLAANHILCVCVVCVGVTVWLCAWVSLLNHFRACINMRNLSALLTGKCPKN